jgi:hypothetical protein
MTRTPLFGYGLGLGLGACIAAVLALPAPSASADPAQVSQPRTVSAFHAVDLAGTLQVEVTVGKPASVEITGDADLVDRVITTVKDGALVIDTPELRDHHHHDKRNRHLRAIVTAPDLSALTISGTGTMKVTGIANQQLALSLPGTGALTVTGSTGAVRVELGGTGEVSARQLAAKDAVIDIAGTGSARLNATRSVDARITGTGSVAIHGHPSQVRKSVSGLGSIHID